MKLKIILVLVVLVALLSHPVFAWGTLLKTNQKQLTFGQADSSKSFSAVNKNSSSFTAIPYIFKVKKNAQLNRSITDLSSLYKEVCSSIVVILAYDTRNGTQSQGSGFFIDAAGGIITNWHVVKGSDKIEIRSTNGDIYDVKYAPAKDVDGDLVLLSADIPGHVANPLRLNESLPSVGEDIVVIGSPKNLTQTMTRGIVSAVRVADGYGTIIQTDAAISSGSSGSPVFNKNGEVVGVVFSEVPNAEGLNFAVSAKRVQTLINKAQSNSGQSFSSLAISLSDDPYSKAMDLYRNDKYEMALSYFEEAIKNNESNAWAWTYKASTLSNLGDLEESLQASNKAIELDPLNQLTWMIKASTLTKLDRNEEALKASQLAIKLDEQNTMAWIVEAVAFINLDRFDESLNSSQRALTIDPENAVAWYLKSIALNHLDQKADAEAALSKSKELGFIS